MLKDTITPDSKTKLEHFESMMRYKQGARVSLSKAERSQQFHEREHNFHINRKNCAGVFYTHRDIDVLRNNMCEKDQNAKILEYLHPFTNQNVQELNSSTHNHWSE